MGITLFGVITASRYKTPWKSADETDSALKSSLLSNINVCENVLRIQTAKQQSFPGPRKTGAKANKESNPGPTAPRRWDGLSNADETYLATNPTPVPYLRQSPRGTISDNGRLIRTPKKGKQEAIQL